MGPQHRAGAPLSVDKCLPDAVYPRLPKLPRSQFGDDIETAESSRKFLLGPATHFKRDTGEFHLHGGSTPTVVRHIPKMHSCIM